MENVGARIKAFRESRNLTQKDIFQATQGEIKQTSLSAIENNQAKPGFDTLTALLNAYPELNSDWLLLGVGPMLKNGQLPPPVPSEAKPTPGTLRRNRDDEDGNYWQQIARERGETIELLKQLLKAQFPGLAELPGKLRHGEYAAVAMSEPVGFRQAGRQPLMFVARTGHRLEWVDELAQSLTVAPAPLKKTA